MKKVNITLMIRALEPERHEAKPSILRWLKKTSDDLSDITRVFNLKDPVLLVEAIKRYFNVQRDVYRTMLLESRFLYVRGKMTGDEYHLVLSRVEAIADAIGFLTKSNEKEELTKELDFTNVEQMPVWHVTMEA